MVDEAVSTYFAPAERTDRAKLDQQILLLSYSMLLSEVADAIPSLLMVLNGQREVVYVNQQIMDLLQIKSIDEIKGKRPGELFSCTYSDVMPGGCGTSEFCQVCGAANAIVDALNGKRAVNECHLLTKENNALTMQAWATPYKCKGENYVIFLLTDMSDLKRRQSLEQLFFHDIMNSADGISGLASILISEEDSQDATEIIEMIQRSATRLVEEIKSQRQLAAAERGEFKTTKNRIESIDLLQEVAESYANHETGNEPTITIDPESANVSVLTDMALARRVLGNMTKNALEASSPGETVTLSCSDEANQIVFSVHNPCFMPVKIQLQMFQRSFTTKGSGRGIGTYSMKLFGEKYLGGKVSFKSTEDAGTTFYLKLPKPDKPELKIMN